MRLLESKRLFYIEDNIENRAIAQMLLEQAGAKVGFERWGRDEALTKLASFGHVDAILLDLMFPKRISGYDVYTRIRELPQFRYTPIIAVSASDPAIEIPRTRAYGFAGFISKPINLRHFANQVYECLSGEPVWDAG